MRPGSVPRPEIAPGVRSYHLRFSRDRVQGSTGSLRNRDICSFIAWPVLGLSGLAASCMTGWSWNVIFPHPMAIS